MLRTAGFMPSNSSGVTLYQYLFPHLILLRSDYELLEDEDILFISLFSRDTADTCTLRSVQQMFAKLANLSEYTKYNIMQRPLENVHIVDQEEKNLKM